MAIKGNITVPTHVVTGAFNIRVSLEKAVTDFYMANILIENVSGAALGGHASDRFGGHGRSYHFLCYPPENTKGQSRISLTGAVLVDGVSENLEALERSVNYDTVRTVTATFGTATRNAEQLTLPITISEPVVGLTKKHFSFSTEVGRWYLYGSNADYELVFSNPPDTFTVSTTKKALRKANGVNITIEYASVEVS